jgi:TetR/AcrR family fatty acid metabolism transcriptional regulator
MPRPIPAIQVHRDRHVSRDPGRRQRILDVAKRHFTERGFLGTRLDDVAAEAGCAKGAIYLEFDDKETLLRDVLDQTFTDVMARFTRDVVGLPSPLARLRETLRFAYRQHAAEPLFGRLLRDDPELRFLRGAHNDEWKTGAAERVAMIQGWVDEGIRAGEIRPDVDRDVIPALIGVLRMAPQHLGLVTAGGAVSGERVLDAVVDLFAAGLAAPGGGAARRGTRPRARTAINRRRPKGTP